MKRRGFDEFLKDGKRKYADKKKAGSEDPAGHK
jgi:hypothetical protein